MNERRYSHITKEDVQELFITLDEDVRVICERTPRPQLV